MSGDLEAWSPMPWERRGSYDVEYMGIVVGLVRDRIGTKSLAHRLDVPKETMREWLLSYRIGGKMALMGEHEGNRRHNYEAKLAAVSGHLERGMSRPEVMERYDITSQTHLKQWCQGYHREGPEALRPKPEGRPEGAKPKSKPAPTREQLLEEENAYLKARVAYLEKVRALLASKPTAGGNR